MHLNPVVRRGEYLDRVVRITSFAVVIDEAIFPAHVAVVITGLADEGPAPANLQLVRSGLRLPGSTAPACRADSNYILCRAARRILR